MGSVNMSNMNEQLVDAIYRIENALQASHVEHTDMEQRLARMEAMLEGLGAEQFHTRLRKMRCMPESSNSSFSSNGSERQRNRTAFHQGHCMREAIRLNTSKLVNSLMFKETKLPDLIIEKGIVSEEESQILRNLTTSEDQISALISIALKRDITCMNAFLDIIVTENETVEKDIRNMYDELIQDSDARPRKYCTICEIKSICEIKWVYNHLFANDLILEDLHRKIAFEPGLCNGQALWDEMFQQLSHASPRWVYTVLIEAIEGRNNSNETLLAHLRRLLRKGKKLCCSCPKEDLRNRVLRNNTTIIVEPIGPNKSSDSKNEVVILCETPQTQLLKGLKSVENVSERKHEDNNVNIISKQEDETIPKWKYTESQSTGDINDTPLSLQNKNTVPKEINQETSPKRYETISFDSQSRPSDTDSTYLKQVSTDPCSKEYETIWSFDKRRSSVTDRQVTDEGTTAPEGSSQASPLQGRKGSGSNETQVKRLISGEHEEGKKFHRKHYDTKRLKQIAISKREQTSTKEDKGTG